MYESLSSAVEAIEGIVATFEPTVLSGRDAVRLVDLFAKLERVAAAGRTLAGRRVEQTRAWYGSGYANPSKWMAARAQTSLGAAIATLETGRYLEALPATRDAFASGALSAQQAQHISAAAAVNPAAESSLLDAARKDTVGALRQECDQVIAAASNDIDEDERLYRGRYLRMRPRGGMIELDARLTMDAGAKLMATLGARAQELLSQARARGSRERREAYAADALVGLVTRRCPVRRPS
jgi:hypothetical protein